MSDTVASHAALAAFLIANKNAAIDMYVHDGLWVVAVVEKNHDEIACTQSFASKSLEQALAELDAYFSIEG